MRPQSINLDSAVEVEAELQDIAVEKIVNKRRSTKLNFES